VKGFSFAALSAIVTRILVFRGNVVTGFEASEALRSVLGDVDADLAPSFPARHWHSPAQS